MTDLLVVGFDLATRRIVDIGEREVWEWHKKGHNGDRSLVCWLCYEGADGSGDRRLVALVPRGRKGGRRRAHFAHPPGMAPAVGQHMPETVWHYTAKHRMQAWAEMAGADSARVEVYTRDGRRRSDVAVTMPGGARIGIEVQQGEITDTEWLSRQCDYNRNGVAVSWIWRPAAWIPQVIYENAQPGWVLELDKNRIGLVCAKAHEPVGRQGSGADGVRSVHWPPCTGDETEIRWMPLPDLRLSPRGLQPSNAVVTQLSRETAGSERHVRETTAQPRRPNAPSSRPAAGFRPTNRTGDSNRPESTYLVQRIDGKPPWADPEDQLYYCPACGYLTGVELRASPIPHEVAGLNRVISREDLQPHPVRPATRPRPLLVGWLLRLRRWVNSHDGRGGGDRAVGSDGVSPGVRPLRGATRRPPRPTSDTALSSARLGDRRLRVIGGSGAGTSARGQARRLTGFRRP